MESQSALAVETKGLVKVFGETRAVDGVDLAVPAGTVYGVLGPNGAGKTTTLRMLATLLRPDAGSAKVFGQDVLRDPAAVRSRMSMTGQFASVDEELNGYENIVLIARLLGYSRSAAKARADQLLDAFDLVEAGPRLLSTYSGGMRRRLDIALSIIVTPDLLFLDEPTAGLDPRSRNQLWDIVREIVAAGTTVLLTTQYLDEADQLTDRIAVIDRGKVIAEGTPGELKASVGSGAVQLRLLDPAQRPAAGEILNQVLRAQVHLGSDPAAMTVAAADPDEVSLAIQELSRAGVRVTQFAFGQPSLDEVFLALTGRPAQDPKSDDDEEEAA